MSSYYPIFLKIQGKNCVVIGGGKVAERKVRGLLEHGASILVISPSLSPGLKRLAKKGQIRAEARGYQAGDLDSAFIAIAATDDPRINLKVAQEAKEKGVLANIADEQWRLSDFILPSTLRRREFAIAVSTGGANPALARRIREELENLFPQE